MFQSLSKKLLTAFDHIRSKGVLTEELVEKAMREIRVAFLEADVSLSVTKQFIEDLKKIAVGQNITKKVGAADMVVKIVSDQLIDYLGKDITPINLKGAKPYCVLMVGLQGSGKTTTTAKLGNLLAKDKATPHKVLMVSLDSYRPAAKEQLKQLGEQTNIDTLPVVEGEDPITTAKRALQFAKESPQKYEIVLFDTAGRLHIDDALMDEVKKLQSIINPCETMLVADAMTGQDAVKIAEAFTKALPLTGVILTRVDGDARGGAALSMKYVTKCPIKYMGVGEKIENLEVFDPSRIAMRILDMGDIVAFVEKATAVSKENEEKRMEERFKKGKFDLNDMAHYLQKMQSMGGFSGIMAMLPGMGRIQNNKDLSGKLPDDRMLKREVAIISSMTPKEKRDPALLNAHRRKRIAKGSGVEVSDVNKLIKKYEQMQQMFKQLGKGFPGMGLFGNMKNIFNGF